MHARFSGFIIDQKTKTSNDRFPLLLKSQDLFLVSELIKPRLIFLSERVQSADGMFLITSSCRAVTQHPEDNTNL